MLALANLSAASATVGESISDSLVATEDGKSNDIAKLIMTSPTAASGPAELKDSALQARPEVVMGQVPLPVSGAGLVLLHPFFPTLFTNAGVSDDVQSRLTASMLPRAGALLRDLAAGRDDGAGSDLVVIKILLGLAPDDLVQITPGLLSDRDRRECESLIRAALSHWTALKDLSAADFRASFLSRPGLLRWGAGSWDLQVQRMECDVLVDQIPWPLSPVVLPWMPHPLSVQW